MAGRCSLLPAAVRERRVWRCAACRVQFSVLAGTIFEGTRLPLRSWVAVLGDVAVGAVSARELARRHDLTPATARLARARLLAADVRVGDAPDDALRRILRLPPDEVARVRRAVPGRRDLREGPSLSLT